MQVRKIFFDAVHFVPKHIMFAAYYFLLMTLSELLQFACTISLVPVAEEALSLSENQAVQPTGFSALVQGYIPEGLNTLLKQTYMPYILFALTFVLLLVFMGVTFIIQALLRKRDASLVHETTHSFHALIRAPWAVLYFLALAAFTSFAPYFISTQAVQKATTPFVFLPFYGLTFLILVIILALAYFQQLLYDNCYSLSSVLHTSWEYLKKSWFVVFKLYLNLAVIALFFLLVSMLLAAFVPLSFISVLQFLLKTYLNLLGIVGCNMIYLQMRSEK